MLVSSMTVKLQEMYNVTFFQFWNLIAIANENNFCILHQNNLNVKFKLIRCPVVI